MQFRNGKRVVAITRNPVEMSCTVSYEEQEQKERIQGWIGVDLDGTLAYYDDWKGIEHIGEPIPEMVERVRKWIEEGKTVKIFTARVGKGNDADRARAIIIDWCSEHIGRPLEVTCEKDFGMIELWDDRCTQVIPNTGKTLG